MNRRAQGVGISGFALIVIGLCANNWLPTGVFDEIGSLGNSDRIYLLRGLSIVLPMLGVCLIGFRRTIAKNLAGLIVMTLSTLVALTMFVIADIVVSQRAIDQASAEREIADVHMPDSLLGWRPKPGAKGTHREEDSFDVTYQIDDQGFKATPRHGVASRRIFVFGDSYTFGHGVTNADTYSNVMSRDYFIESVHVYNAGVMGYSIEQMYGRYLELAASVEAGDLIVFAPTSQDIKRNLKDFTFPSKLIFGRRTEFGQTYPYYDDGELTARELNTPANERLAKLFNAQWTKRVFRFLHSAITSPDTTREALAMVDRVKRDAAARGADFALFFLPQTKECIRQDYEEDIDAFEYYDIMAFFPQEPAALEELRFATDTHWNASGHRIAARAIVWTLIREGLIRPFEIQRPSRSLFQID